MRRAIVLLALCCLVCAAEVVRLDITDRSPVLGGRTWGAAGAYERLKGKAILAVDPKAQSNVNIVDLNKAEKNPKGLVEFQTDIYILRPVDLGKGNGTVLFDVPNRGNKGLLSTFNRGRNSADPQSLDHFGDGMLLEQGYTLVWIGWQTDVPAGADRMRLYAPTARGVRGLVRSEFTPERPVSDIPLGDSGHTPYPVSRSAPVTVTERDSADGPRRELPSSQWELLDEGTVRLKSPAVPGRIYEIVYTSVDPPVTALGLAAVRDVLTYVKRDYKHVIGLGTSQSGAFLRGFLYEGFNQSEQGTRVMDGVWAHVAGARRLTFHRFTQLSRTAGPLRGGTHSTTEQFPFTDADVRDPLTGRTDGILHRARQANVVPKIFYTNSTYEYWGSGGSLTHTTPDGKRDVAPPPTTRIYLLAGGQHGPGSFPPTRGRAQHLANFNDYRWALRALLPQLRAWVAEDREPPPSAYPRLADGTLATLSSYRFPKLPGVEVPASIQVHAALDFGSQYRRAGVITNEPPRVTGHYVTLVPQAGPDGNDLAGVRMPEIRCALGAFTGWNLRSTAAGSPDRLMANLGSFFPLASHRFASETAYSSCIETATKSLAADRLLLPADAPAVVDAAARHWKWITQELPVRAQSAPEPERRSDR